MVVPTDAQVAFVIASFWVDVGRGYIETEHKASPERSRLAYCRFRNWAVLYPALCLVPVIVVFFSAWPAWETQYWTSYAERLLNNGFYALFAGLFLFLVVAAGFLGNYLSFNWIINGKGKLVRSVYLTVLAITIGIYFIQWPAPIRLGSVAQFMADPYSMPYIWDNGQFFGLYLLLLTYCAIPVVVVLCKLRKKIRGTQNAN